MKRIPRTIWIARMAWVCAGLIYGFAAVGAPMPAKIIMAMIVGAAISFVPTRTE